MAGTVLIAGACAVVTAWAIDSALSAFRDTNAMVALITQDGVLMDDKNAEKQLAGATAALRFCYEVALSLGIAVLFIASALALKIWKHYRG